MQIRYALNYQRLLSIGVRFRGEPKTFAPSASRNSKTTAVT